MWTSPLIGCKSSHSFPFSIQFNQTLHKNVSLGFLTQLSGVCFLVEHKKTAKNKIKITFSFCSVYFKTNFVRFISSPCGTFARSVLRLRTMAGERMVLGWIKKWMKKDCVGARRLSTRDVNKKMLFFTPLLVFISLNYQINSPGLRKRERRRMDR